MTKTPIKISTLEEYINFDDGTDKRYELEDGVLLEMPPGTGKHEAIITLLLVRFFLEIQKMGLPLQPRPNGTEVLTNKQLRRPDVCVITNEQAKSIETTSAILKTAPPLLVEVVSPESIDRDYNQKTFEYVAMGVFEYWIVDPLENKITVCLLDQSSYKQTMFIEDQRVVSQTFPELILTAQQLFSP
ncbi:MULTISPECIES: Uma2 family endonuclease [unclassified Nostoc]|uniref:Uma2 family endonuclease n=1 Tax=unclassified Nostoc TaxID=2593658 RepID=UPI002AD1F1DC|nr:Uma2 family endonuclease [Nostoc sp. DedQUE03]MDZ7972728.1 Uma2 family endonuclease [Nostoc sp. DedQUE03]MDZ8046091.1 Uma2 family endonuclease [Nostoc sp. DedQUE02]